MKKKNCLFVLTLLSILLAQSYAVYGQEGQKKPQKKTTIPRESKTTLQQTTKGQHKEFSLMVGALRSTITGNSEWIDPLGLQAGFIYPFVFIGNAMSIRAEANISMQGAKWEIVTETGRTSLLYINVPIVFRYRHSTGFFGEAGFQPGLLLSAKDIYEGESEDYKDYFRTVDFGIPVGAGYEFGNGIGVGLRVIPGISRINRNGYTIDRNNIVSLRATYTFILK